MTRKTLTAAFGLAAMGLAACSPHGGRMGANSNICADFGAKAVTPAALVVPTDAQPVDECTRRWAYSLASSRDDADAVADAVASACAATLSKWNQASLAGGGPQEAMSLTTGQPTSAIAEHNSFAHARALFYVVEARAGRCAPPAVKDGVPEGLPA